MAEAASDRQDGEQDDGDAVLHFFVEALLNFAAEVADVDGQVVERVVVVVAAGAVAAVASSRAASKLKTTHLCTCFFLVETRGRVFDRNCFCDSRNMT